MKKNIEHYAIKCKMKSILRYKDMFDIIQKKVNNTNKIWTETYFLFYQHILKLLSSGKTLTFDYSTIERCVLFVINKSSSIKVKDTEYFEISDTYEKYYKPLGKSKLDDFQKEKSVSRPFEYLSRQIMTNIKNHCQLNFYKFQKKYLKFKVYDKLLDLKLSKKILNSIVNCLQFHINYKTDKLTIKSKYIRQLDNLKDIIPIMINIIKVEKSFFPSNIFENISDKNLTDNFTDVLKYYYHMINILEVNDKKRFSILPNISFGYTYVKFDSRFLSTVYDDWIDIKLKESKTISEFNVKEKYNIDFNLEKVGIKEFEKNYKMYYKRIFKLDKFPKDDNLISIATNGYCVNLLYEKEKSKKKSDDNKIIKLEEHLKDKHIKKGLFDADKCTSTEEFLDDFHKIAIDPNNGIMLYCYSETGRPIKISKGYYNETSHITQNTRKMKRYVKESSMHKIYEKLQETSYKKTIKIEKFNELIKIIRSNWEKIWSFYSQNKVQKLEFDTFTNKKKAIHKIIRKLVPKNNTVKFNKYENKFLDDLEKDILDKPTFIAFGKGNGSITISNLKNSGPKGPIKTIAKELSRYCIVMLTDEFRTSKICSDCKTTELEHPIIERSKTKIIKIDGKKEKVKELKSIACHGLCHCKNDIHLSKNKTNVHKTWNRDYNASKNILHVMTRKLLKKNLGIFDRKKADKKEKTEEANDPNTSWSLDQISTEKGT